MSEQNESTNKEKKLRFPRSAGVRASFLPDGDAIKDSVLFKKQASASPFGAGTDTVRLPLTYIDPLFDPVLVLFPKENIKELNRRLRHYYNYHPIVGTVIDIHVEFSLCDFELATPDDSISAVYNEMKEELSLHELLMQAARDYFLLGEAYLYGAFDDYNAKWSGFVQYPPENIEVFKTYVGPGVVYALKADEELKRVLMSNKATDRAIANMIPDDLKEAILKGKPYILSNNNLIVLARRPAAYVVRGASLLTRVLKYLLLEEKLLLLLFTYIDTSTFPIKVCKVGDASKGIMPTSRQINEMRTLLMQAASDPNFTIVTHPFVSFDFPTPVGKFEDPVKLLDFVYKRILIGLMASDEFLKGAASAYSSATVNARLVMMRYLAFRARVENILKYKIFKPVAVARGFKDKNGNLILPSFKWKQRNLLNEQAERDLLLRLRERGEIPLKLICDTLNIDYEKLRKDYEAEASTIFDPVYRDAIREKSKDKGIINQVILGKTVPDAIRAGADTGVRITKPGRPSVTDTLRSLSENPLFSRETVPPRTSPLEMGRDTKPIGESKPSFEKTRTVEKSEKEKPDEVAPSGGNFSNEMVSNK